MNLKDLHTNLSSLKDTPLMPALFIGHGSPMNAIEDNEFSRMWSTLGDRLPIPNAIVCISAHWETRGTSVTMSEHPKTIHDFYGFPRELYQQDYPASGAPLLAQDVIDHITHTHIKADDQWGLDHGTWTVLKYTYPQADIPVIQISLDHYKDAKWHYELGKELAFLRNKGVLVIGSGNMIHNLGMLRVAGDDFNAEYGYDWSFELNDILKTKLKEGDSNSLIRYHSLHKEAGLAVPTPEHYIPMLYVLGMRNKDEEISIFNDKVIAASISMTSFMIGGKDKI
ncbi:MAG TPA: 4,5-DOPA dioxygenase extradiol [Porphyromonadaceae bacterium]|nr:4,5-DOPA dioxygenase extradiol [Porphyromonadaceae bacterium]HBK32524.1 4,5-DOPA dioxygenase extradiol [Porphyromonadaceae bacterium]HBL34864.1 4,5-DOPA dioxygenase extradiol [Porphyromonadaceae bacterium]HBX20699.1 4,5-DOPA dioxygenase extradiol [Porphyromonadaceae bacterium]HCM20739.1 4,5-DOPA dioxygenase extradiol [Porphyromonadaceae bacterium]